MSILRAGLQKFRVQDLEPCTLEQLADDLVELELIDGWLQVEKARRLAVFANKQGHHLEGHSSVTAFLKHRCRMAAGRAQQLVGLAHRLPGLPFVDKAVTGGDISLDQARVMVNLPDHLSEDLARDEVTLVNAVAPLSVADTRRVVEYWRAAVEGPGYETTAAELEARRYLHASKTFEGMVKIDGLLAPAAGDLFLTALRAATPPPGPEELRRPAQRRADALADLCRSFLDSGEASGTEKPHVVVMTDVDALCGHGGGIHETADGQVLTPEQIRQYACDCVISRVVFGPGGEPVDIGRASRVVPASMRRAVIARDRHCQGPGCDRPARWAEIHHIVHWADGGSTAIANLKLLCRYHHTQQHRKNVPVRRR